MNTCKDCKHWSRNYAGRSGGVIRSYPNDESRLGSCDRWLQGYGHHEATVPSNEVLVENDEGWAAVMGPDFGCVLWEQK